MINAIVWLRERPPQEPIASQAGASYDYIWHVAEQAWAQDSSDRPSMSELLPSLWPALLIPRSELDISPGPMNQSGGSCDLYSGHHVRFGRVALKRLRGAPSEREAAIRVRLRTGTVAS